MRTIAVIGGGFSGSILAAQLLRRARTPLRILLVENGGRVGPGLAYGSAHPVHLLNVPAGKMSALAEEPEHFLRWARESSPHAQAGSFLPRRLYGRYISWTLDEARRSSPAQLEVHAAHARGLQEKDGRFGVLLDGGGRLEADLVVLAMGNYPPSLPFEIGTGVADHAGFVADFWNASERRIAPDASILVVGTGLTMADAVLGLAAKGHRGPIRAVSRRGALPGRHDPSPRVYPPFLGTTPGSAREVLRLTRREIRKAAADGFAWQEVFDALRPQTNAIWARFGAKEKKRFLRHAQVHWDSHRHRMPPEVHDAVLGLRSAQRLSVEAGRVLHVGVSPEGKLQADVRRRGRVETERFEFDCVVNCTGPGNLGRVKSPLLENLLTNWARLDPLGLGLETNPDSGAVLDGSGRESRRLFALGPLRKGSLWETTAVPELREQARRMSEDLLEIIR